MLLLQTGFLTLFILFLLYATFFADWRPRNLSDLDMTNLGGQVDDIGPWAAMVVAVFAQALGTVMLVPGFLLIIGTAILFGLHAVWISVLGQTLGAAGGFLIGRHVGRDPILALLGQRLVAIERLVEGGGGFRYLLLMRLASVLPAAVIVYAPGIINIRFRHMVLAALIGLLPFALAFTLVGNALRGVGSVEDLGRWDVIIPILLLFFLVTVPVLTVAIVRRVRRRRRTPGHR